MKRTLVCYSSSDDDDEHVIVKKRPVSVLLLERKSQTNGDRKLPSLPTSLVAVAPVDDPSQHQGRIRTTPHSEGQFAAYVYVAVSLSDRLFVDEVLNRAKELVPTLQPIANGELHISLSRPTYLRHHQRDEFKRTVKAVASRHSPFPMSFATLAELTNDERTRTFLALEVGAGHEEFKKISDGLTPVLKAIKQKEFYENPRFHASIGWALLDLPPGAGNSASSAPSENNPSSPQIAFPTIPSFPSDMIPTLKQEFGRRLAQAKLSASNVSHICSKIGNQVSRWPLLET